MKLDEFRKQYEWAGKPDENGIIAEPDLSPDSGWRYPHYYDGAWRTTVIDHGVSLNENGDVMADEYSYDEEGERELIESFPFENLPERTGELRQISAEQWHEYFEWVAENNEDPLEEFIIPKREQATYQCRIELEDDGIRFWADPWDERIARYGFTPECGWYMDGEHSWSGICKHQGLNPKENAHKFSVTIWRDRDPADIARDLKEAVARELADG